MAADAIIPRESREDRAGGGTAAGGGGVTAEPADDKSFLPRAAPLMIEVLAAVAAAANFI